MAGPPNKRQKRLDYQRAQAAATAAAAAGGSRSVSLVTGGEVGGGKTGMGMSVRVVEMPKKKFYRQRAHANPFSDHALV